MNEQDGAGVSLVKSEGPADAPEPVAGDYRIEAAVTGAAYGALTVLGFVVGLVGSFAYNWMLGAVPITAIVLVAVNFAGPLLAGRAMGGKAGALVPSATWAAVVIVLSVKRPEGDLVVAGTTTGYLFIIGGMAAAGLAIMLTPSAGPPGAWLLGGAARTGE